MSWARMEEKHCKMLLAECWRWLVVSASSDLDALDFLGWAWLDPMEGSC